MRKGEGSRESIKRYLAFLNGTWPIEWHFEGVGKRGGRARGSNKWKETKQGGGGIRDVGATSDSGVESEEAFLGRHPLFYSSSSSSSPLPSSSYPVGFYFVYW